MVCLRMMMVTLWWDWQKFFYLRIVTDRLGSIILRFREEFAKFVELDEMPVDEMSSNDD